MLQCVAVCCSVTHRHVFDTHVAVCCSVLQCVAVSLTDMSLTRMLHIERVTIQIYVHLHSVIQSVIDMSHIERVTIHICMCICTV